jgi:Leucine-rich repeat (LRR) protein
MDNEFCSCVILERNIILKLDCLQQTNDVFIQNVTKTKYAYDFFQMIEFNLKNKLINNISSSNARHLLSLNLKILSIENCKIKSIEKGIFNLMIEMENLSLIRNEIKSIETDSFLTHPFETHLLKLHLSENKLIQIKRGSFNGLVKMVSLFLDKNQIEEIEFNSFENLNELKELNILSNKIKMIKNEFLSERIQLEYLYLYQNNIDNIETIPFNTLYSLKKLHLFSNKIINIKFGNFIHLVKLEEFKLDKNEIGSFDANTFVGLEKLLYLDLSANKIKKLVNGAFHGLKKLQTLDLHLNDINLIEMNAFSDLENLNDLKIDSNQIKTLKNVQFNTALQKISVRFNLLSSLNELNSSSLIHLCVSNNRIQVIDSITQMPCLEYLDLSQNRLISIEENSFTFLKKLKHLNLSQNKLDLESEFNNISFFNEQFLLENLDLGFNEIKYLDSNLTFKNLNSLKVLNLTNNKLKSVDLFLFGFMSKLSELNLAYNNLSFINEKYFFNLKNLKMLILSFNQINSTDFLKSNQSDLNNLEMLYLDHNKIVSIEENTFDLTLQLKFLSLNSNPVKNINEKSLEKLDYLETLKLSNTSINSLSLIASLKELDISYLNLAILNFDELNTIEWINLANVQTNFSNELFISDLSKYVDFSFNHDVDFRIFNILGSSLETLILRNTYLQNIDHINLKNLVNLKYLDLSFNNLSCISQDSFEFNLNLEYLDLSSNSLYEFSVILYRLKYLFLDNNQLNSTNEVLTDYYSIEIFKMAHNRLQYYPSFEMSQINSQKVETFLEIHLNHNLINEIKYFSFIFGKLLLANFDSNNISLIETDAFLNCRSLESLSIAQNRLKNLTENNFHFLFSLIHLNLSFNEINFIEQNAFINLNKLKSLDLNFNKMLSIENDLFVGLINLNDLYLLSQNEMFLKNQSFQHLPNVSTLVLNESLIAKNKCLFMHNLQRDVQRIVGSKYIFFKSINLLSMNFSIIDDLRLKCDLVFHLFQFKIHYNLKTDFDNDLFYDLCHKVLIDRENNFNHNKRKCFSNFEFTDKQDEKEIELLHPILKVFSNFYYMLSMTLILSLLSPAFYMICRYELFSKLISHFTTDSSNKDETILKELQKEIKIRRVKLVQKIIRNEKLQKAKLNLDQLIENDENNLKMLEERKRKITV